MRWFAPIALVALVAAGAVRPAHATDTSDTAIRTAKSALRSTAALREASGSAKLAPPRTTAGRGAVSDRRPEADQVFVVPRIVTLDAVPTLTELAPFAVASPRPRPAAIARVARGPPSLVVLSRPRH